MKKNFIIHLFQWEIAPGNIEKNLQKAEEMLEKADVGKGDLIVLPEMFPSGFYYRNLDDISGRWEEVVTWMNETARRVSAVISGSLPTLVRGGIANTMFLIDWREQVLARYDKLHLFPGTCEDHYFIPGNTIVTANIGAVKTGLAICFDLRFPELSRRLCLEGVEIMLLSAQWPRTRIDHFKDLVRIRAMENQMFIAACNSCGEDSSGMSLGGESMIAEPSGTIAGILGSEEGVLSLKIDLEKITEAREGFPVLKCRRGDVYGEG